MPMTMTALSTSCMASTAAWNADLPYSRMWRSMFSTTTMASSTTMPIASTMPNSVSVLIEKPNSFTNANVPMSDTGMVSAGMMVLRQFCRNRNITSTTSSSASPRVFNTSTIDSRTTVTLSKASCHSRPGGKFFSMRRISDITPWNTSRALAVGSSCTPRPEASRFRNRRLAE